MALAPTYNIGDTVYLRGSAEIGKLESFKITSVKQTQDGQWVYSIDIFKKPPSRTFVGDTFDSRISELAIYYIDSELISLCDALSIMENRLIKQINSVNAKITAICGDNTSNATDSVGPRWSIGDIVYYESSARVGFLESTKITQIHQNSVQPGSNKVKYRYAVSGLKQHLYFKENELISFCEAAYKVLSSLQNELDDVLLKKGNVCS